MNNWVFAFSKVRLYDYKSDFIFYFGGGGDFFTFLIIKSHFTKWLF